MSSRRERESQSVHLRRAILKASNNQLAFALGQSDAASPPSTISSPTRRNSSSSSSITPSLKSAAAAAAVASTSHLPIYQYLQSSDDAYNSRLQALSKFKKKSKTQTRTNTLKNEYLTEHAALSSQQNTVERDLNSLLEVLAASHPGEELIQALISDYFLLGSDRQASQREAVGQVGDIRGLLRETLRQSDKARTARAKADAKSRRDASAASGEAGHQESEEPPQTEPPPSAAILSVMLLQIHQHLHAFLDSLSLEEASLAADIGSHFTRITSMLRGERRREQQLEIDASIKPAEDDDEQVLLAIEEWRGKLDRLDQSHQTELGLMRAERARADATALGGGDVETASGNEETGGTDEASDDLAVEPAVYGGWPKGHHDAFSKAYTNAQKTGLRRAALLLQLSAMLPSYTAQQIAAHEQWYRATKALALKRGAAVTEYEEKRLALIAEARAQLELVRRQRAEERARRGELESAERARNALHQHLSELREARAFLEQQRQVEKEREDASARSQAEKEAALIRLEQEHKKREVAAFQAAQRKLQEELAAEAARLAERARVERSQLIDANREKVEAREAQRLQKEEERRQQELRNIQKEADKMAALMRLAEQVPYYDDIVNATSKLDHETAAYKAQTYVEYGPEARGFTRPTGFTDTKIISDARFRLAAALRDAAPHLIHSTAARGVIASFHPRPHLAIHGVLSRTGGVI